MKFGLFYEIPVPRPWHERSELEAYQNVLEQAVLGDQVGFHSFWTVEHHFLEEFSHCSNPEVLYGHVAALTKNLKIGYGVRLLPKPYNHPVRSAESAKPSCRLLPASSSMCRRVMPMRRGDPPPVSSIQPCSASGLSYCEIW